MLRFVFQILGLCLFAYTWVCGLTGYGRVPCIDGTIADRRSLVHLMYGVQAVYVEGLSCRVPVLRLLLAAASVSNGAELAIRPTCAVDASYSVGD